MKIRTINQSTNCDAHFLNRYQQKKSSSEYVILLIHAWTNSMAGKMWQTKNFGLYSLFFIEVSHISAYSTLSKVKEEIRLFIKQLKTRFYYVFFSDDKHMLDILFVSLFEVLKSFFAEKY